jgi:phosphoribosylaminoimidazolecarboxamide formyltransferase/IMP cyclohydrolase
LRNGVDVVLRALISVYDKTGIADFARALVDGGYELVSTGGTFRTLSEDAGLPVQQVADVTGSPEILEGRVKTLHPVIHAGLLARRDSPGHLAELEKHRITPIDLVAVNLYPFVATISQPGATLEDALENIDIGGPTMLRAAAKNFPSVTVVVDPEDYVWVARKMADQGLSLEERRNLAAKAFEHVSTYDTAVAGYLASGAQGADALPDYLSLFLNKVASLRYGENPHQQGALYVPIGSSLGGVAGAKQLHGRELSYNNLMDADAAWRIVCDFPDNTAAVIKHANPCGLASHPDQAEAYRRAYGGDQVSAFGGIVGFNQNVTTETAEAMRPVFYEVVVAPGYEPEALEILKQKRNLRILSAGQQGGGLDYDLRPISGGLLVQGPDKIDEDPTAWKTATVRAPTPFELQDLGFAWRAAKHIKSNAIVFAKDRTLVGMGAGQPNRVVSVHLSQRVAGEKSKGSALASDAFFPFPDNIDLAADAGVTAIIQPGGSVRDEEVVEAANKYDMAMVFTGVRHFRH